MSDDRVQREPAVRETPVAYEAPTGLDPGREPSKEDKQVWINAWRTAAVELARIDDEELRQLDDESALALILGTSSAPCVDEVEVGERNGLVTLQAWFMRFRLLQLEREARTE